MSITASRGTALITGASSGIGAIYADRLAKRGYDLILVARNEMRLDELSDRLQRETGRHISTLIADLNDKAQLLSVADRLKSDPSIMMLVNNAGVGAVAPLLQADIDKMDDMISLNVGALTHLAYAAAPGFVARGAGAIINISSVVAIEPEMLNGVYGASKAYVMAFSQSLHHELREKGVRIQAVLPGATATDFWDIAGYSHQNLPKEMVMSAEDMVDAALLGFDRGEVVTIPALANEQDWTTYENARRAMFGRMSNSEPGARYKVQAGGTV